jgi:hypothetical protein
MLTLLRVTGSCLLSMHSAPLHVSVGYASFLVPPGVHDLVGAFVRQSELRTSRRLEGLTVLALAG